MRPDVNPKFCKARPVPFAIRGAIEAELESLEQSGIIHPVTHSNWAAPIVAVPKKDGRFRICGDYKVTINRALEIDQYPLPKPDDLFATLAGGKQFSKLDLSQAYQQLLLDEESAKLVTINTHRGLYRYSRLPFGVASAPAMFQQVMDTILQGIPGVICYLDDILVTGRDEADHLNHLAAVLERLQRHGVRVKREKCAFLQASVEYLGHQVDADGLHTLDSKLQAVVDAPAPRDVQELRSFLGLVNYYGKFIANLATILHPLNALLQKDRQWRWSRECASAFQQAKDQLTSSRVLAHYDPALPIKLAADASAYGVGAVIAHVFADGTEHPIAFASRTLTSSERNYAQIEKEALALIFGVRKFHPYLYGRKFTLVTDHKPLTSILGPKKGIPSLAAARLQRWAVLLSAYTYDIEFKPTGQHGNADGLSRLPLTSTQPEASGRDTDTASVFNVTQLESLPVTAKQVQAATQSDTVLSKVLHCVQKGWPEQVSDTLLPYHRRRLELTVEGGCLLWGMRVVVPQKLQQAVLDELHRDHPGITRMKAVARSHVWWPGIDRDVEELAKSCLSCQEVKQAPAVAPLHPWVWPTKPWSRVHVDFAGPFLGTTFFIAVDAHSKWPEVYEMSSVTSARTIMVLRHLFAKYGIPEQLVSDNGSQFTSDEFAEFLRANGVKHIRSAPYHPASNGAAERFVRTFKTAMKAGHQQKLSTHHRLENFLLTYRSTPHATTNQTPAALFLGRELRTRLDLLKPSIARQVEEKQASQKEKHDRHAREREFHVGQQVMVRNLRPGPAWVPGTIVKRLGPVSFLVEVSGLIWKRHVDHLRMYTDNPESVGTTENTSAEMDLSISTPSTEPATTNTPNPAVVASDSNERRYPQRERRPPERFM